jgi:hypothetical protein
MDSLLVPDVISVISPGSPTYAVFVSEWVLDEQAEAKPDDVWTEPLLFWAVVRERDPQFDPDEKPLPPRQYVCGVWLDDGSLAYCDDDTTFLVYSHSVDVVVDDWKNAISHAKRRWKKMMET